MAGIAIPVIHRDFCLPSSVRAFNDKGRLRHSTAYGRASTSDGYRWVYQAHKGYRWSVSATLVNQLRQYTGSAKNIRRLPISSQTSNRWVGSYPVTELNPEHIQHYYLEKSKTLAASTIVKHHHLLKQALSQAVEWRSLPRNVAEAVKPPRVARKEMRALSRPEVHRVLEACQDTQWHPIFHTLTWTGLRRSELLGLRWRDIDVELMTLRVVQTLQRLNTGEFIYQEPKTTAGRRTISLSPASCLELRAYRENQARYAEALGIPLTDNTLVFSHPDGSPRSPMTLSNAFRQLMKRIGLEGVRLHDLRHTMASLYLEQGVSPKTVAERLGHASVVITLDLYSHCLPGVQEAAAAQFDAAMESAKSTPAEMATSELR